MVMFNQKYMIFLIAQHKFYIALIPNYAIGFSIA